MVGPTTTRCLVLTLLVLLPACYSWQPTTVAPQVLLDDERPRTVRVTMNGGARVTFQNPTLVNDSIIGSTGDAIGRMASHDVSSMEVRRFSFLKTSALVISHVAVVTGIIALIIHVQPHYYGF